MMLQLPILLLIFIYLLDLQLTKRESFHDVATSHFVANLYLSIRFAVDYFGVPENSLALWSCKVIVL